MNDINKQLYRDLLKKGWTLNQIDESDIFFLFDLLSREEEEQDQMVCIDQIPWM